MKNENPFLNKTPEVRETLSDKVKEKKPRTKKEKRVFKQVSLLLDMDQYEKVAIMAEEQDKSMTKVVRRFLMDKGFFDD